VSRGWEPADVADHRHQRCRGRHIDARDRHQPLDLGVLKRLLRHERVDLLELLAEEVELAQTPINSEPLVEWQQLVGQPPTALDTEQIGDRRAGFEVALQHRRDLVLDLRATLPSAACSTGRSAAARRWRGAAPAGRSSAFG
jgi:hypothetical protein